MSCGCQSPLPAANAIRLGRCEGRPRAQIENCAKNLTWMSDCCRAKPTRVETNELLGFVLSQDPFRGAPHFAPRRPNRDCRTTPLYLGLTYLVWVLIAWGGTAGAFAVALIRRLRVSNLPQPEASMPPPSFAAPSLTSTNLSRVVIASDAATAARSPKRAHWGPSECLMLKLVVLHAT